MTAPEAASVYLVGDDETVMEIDATTLVLVENDVDLSLEPQAELELALDVEVTELVVEPTELLVMEVPGLQGPRGERGEPGPQGTANIQDFSREFNFPIPSDTWTAEHNLGYAPAVMTYDPLGKQQRGVVIENTSVRTVVTYYRPVAGRMTLS